MNYAKLDICSLSIVKVDHKICTNCGEEKLLDEFNKDASGHLKKSAECKTCESLRAFMRQFNKQPWEASKELIATYKIIFAARRKLRGEQNA